MFRPFAKAAREVCCIRMHVKSLRSMLKHFTRGNHEKFFFKHKLESAMTLCMKLSTTGQCCQLQGQHSDVIFHHRWCAI